MPTYEYQCEACGIEFERFQSITAPSIKVCPECQKPKVKRLISGGAGLLFKGSGFYITDYRSEGYKKAAASESPSGSAGNSNGATNGKGNGVAGGNGAATSAKSEAKSAAKAKS